MDVDMIKSSASTALDLHYPPQQHHHLDMITIMMQMENSSPNYQAATALTPSFLDINNFSDSPIFQNPNPNPNNSSSSSFMGLMNGASPNARGNCVNAYEKRSGSMAAMREMIFRIAAMQPIHIDPEAIKPPKRRNVRISKDPQSVAARHRRERISERIRILQRLVPGGTKMDTASMLDEAIHYVKFLKKQVQTLEQAGTGGGVVGFPASGYPGFLKAANNCQPNNIIGNSPMIESMRMLR